MINDNLIVLAVQIVIAVVLYKVNTYLYYTERVQKVMSRSFVATIILALIATYGRMSAFEVESPLMLAIGNLVFLQILFQSLSLIIKTIVWLIRRAQRFGTHSLSVPRLKLNKRHLSTSAVLSSVIIAVIYLVQSNKFDDCELNFIEGTGISKRAYNRIQDDIRALTMKEIYQIASAIPNGSFEDNLKNTLIKSMYYRDCLKSTRTLRRAEKKAIADSLSLYNELESENIRKQNLWLSDNIIDDSKLNDLLSDELAARIWEWLEKGYGEQRIASYLTSREELTEIEFEQLLNTLSDLYRLKIEKDLRTDSLKSNTIWNKNLEKLLVEYTNEEIEEVLSDLDVHFELP